MVIGFFDFVYPVVVVVTLFGLVLGIHLICQHCMAIRSDKKNLFWGLEIFFIVLSTYPYFLLEYSADPFLYWVKAVVSLPLIFFVPGFLFFHLMSQKIAGFKSWTTGFTEVIFIQVLISILFSGFIGLFLAHLGFFSLFYVDFIILCGCIIIAGSLIPDVHLLQFPKPCLNKTSYVLILILFLALALFFHPFPWILGGRDPGVYVNTGVNIANTGAIITHDYFLKNMDNTTRNLFYQIETRPAVLNNFNYQGIQFPGFYITNAQTGEVTPQFFYLWPVWIALFHSIFGLEIALYVTPVFALLSVLGIFLVGKHLYNTSAGLIAALILVLNFAQIWYARYPTSEIISIFIIFSGIFTFLVFIRNNLPFYSCLSAVCFGELLLIRIDSVLIVIPPLIIVVGSGLFGKFRKEHFAFLLPFILFCIYAAVVAFGVSAPYTFDVIKILTGMYIPSWNILLLIGFLGVFLSIILMAIIYLKKKFSDLLQKISAFFNSIINQKRVIIFIQVSVALILTVYVIYNYFIRPSGPIESDSYNLVKLSWYSAGLVGISATVIGITILTGKKPYRSNLFFLSVFGIFAVYQILFSAISPDQPWWIRRYLPIVIPSMIICMGCCVAWLSSNNLFNGKYRIFRNGTACILLMLILVPQVISDSTIVFYSEYHDAIGEINSLEQKFDQNGIIVYKHNYYTDKIATPLYFIYNKTIVKNTPSTASIRTLRNWTELGKTIYFVDAFEVNDIIAPMAVEKFSYNIHWTTLNGMNLQGMSFDNYYNYIIIPHKSIEEQHTFNILILNKTSSIENIFFLGSNWYGLEYWNGVPTRWLFNNATILCHSHENRTVNLTFKAISFHKPRSIEIYSGEKLQIRQTISSSFFHVSVQIPLITGENNIRLYVPEGCERPRDLTQSQNPDTRCLSIAVQNVTIS